MMVSQSIRVLMADDGRGKMEIAEVLV